MPAPGSLTYPALLVTPRAIQIVCTIGPASREADTLEGLIDAGMSVARMNFAHGTPEEHIETTARIRAASKARGRPIAILQDLAGPKIRLGELEPHKLRLRAGSAVTLVCGAEKGDAERLPVPDRYLCEEVRQGGPVLLGDGAVELAVEEVDGREVRCQVTVGGEISSHKGINTPGGLSARPILDEKDEADLALGAELQVDFVGVSYVRNADDLAKVRRSLKSVGRPAPLVAKIETALALQNLEEILARADAVMIARGDLSLEIPYERVPVEQKRIVLAALRAGRPVITATQMLQSMVSAPRPTRAEITDVANAVLDGTDAVMLSDETAVGRDPVGVCRAMGRIADATLSAYPDFPETSLEGAPDELRELSVFARAAVRTARDIGLAAILTRTTGGLAARLISRQRPSVPILAPTRFEDTWRRLTLPFGVRPVLCPRGEMTRRQLEEVIGPQDDQALLLLVGHLPGEHQRVPWMAVCRVGHLEEWARDPQGQRPATM